MDKTEHWLRRASTSVALIGLSLVFGSAAAQEISPYVAKIIEASLAGSERQVAEGVSDTIAAKSPSDSEASRQRKEARLLNAVGLASLKEEKFDEAVESFAKAKASDPADQEVASNLGYAYMKKEDYAKAKEALSAALLLSPDRSSTWATLGETYGRAGDLRRAQACFNLAYKFSQNPAKTKQFLTNLMTDSPYPVVKAAALMSALREGIAVVDAPDAAAPVPAPESAPIAAPSPAPAPVAKAVVPELPVTTAPALRAESTPAPTSKPTPAPKPAKANDGTLGELGGALPLVVGVALGAGVMWFRRKKPAKTEVMSSESSERTSSVGDSSEEPGKTLGRKLLEAAAGIVVGLVIIAVWQNWNTADSPKTASTESKGTAQARASGAPSERRQHTVESLSEAIDNGNLLAFGGFLNLAEGKARNPACMPMIANMRQSHERRIAQIMELPPGLPQIEVITQMALQQARANVQILRSQCIYE